MRDYDVSALTDDLMLAFTMGDIRALNVLAEALTDGGRMALVCAFFEMGYAAQLLVDEIYDGTGSSNGCCRFVKGSRMGKRQHTGSHVFSGPPASGTHLAITERI